MISSTDSSGSSGTLSTHRSSSPLPPGVASSRQVASSPRSLRRSLSPFARDRSNSSPLESDMNRSARFVANIGGGLDVIAGLSGDCEVDCVVSTAGLKKMFGKKEPKTTNRDDGEPEVRGCGREM